MGAILSSHKTGNITDQQCQGNWYSKTTSSNTTSTSGSTSVCSALTRSNPKFYLPDLRQTLNDSKLVAEFRMFLRTLDKNRSDDPQYKNKNERWLDFVIICEQVFEVQEDIEERKINLMVEIGKQFFGRHDRKNIALQNQLNRKELIKHCKCLSKGATSEPDVSLLMHGYDYVYEKLDQKYDLFKKTYKVPTRFAALMCALA